MNIILFGPPGAGKGTQANKLSKDLNLFKISTGDLLRSEIDNKSTLGNKIKQIIHKGEFVSDDIITDLIKNILLDEKNKNRLIFDGYPRNLNQAKELDLLIKKYNQKLSCVLSLNVDKESVVKRILGRQICTKCGSIFNEFFNKITESTHKCGDKYLQKRSDDNEETIQNRFETYLKKTLPILNFYKEQNLLHQINGMAKIDEIYKEIRGIIASIDT